MALLFEALVVDVGPVENRRFTRKPVFVFLSTHVLVGSHYDNTPIKYTTIFSAAKMKIFS